MASKQHNLWQHYANCKLAYVTEGNKIITDVVRLLLGGGTFLFGLTSAIFGSKILYLPSSLKIILIVSWVLIFVSFCFGIKQLYNDSSFLGKWSSLYGKAMEKLAEHEEDESIAVKEAGKIFESQEVVSNMLAFWNQLYFISTAFILQIIVVSISLFLNMK